MTKNSIFFNHSFEKKRLKALISWIHKKFGEKEALRVVDELKITGFTNATRAGLSIGLHDLITPPEKPLIISKAQVAMNKTDQDFKGGKITATERSQRIIDTWHRTSDTLRKQVVDHFNTYDQLNSVYIMALSGARGNFSQVRQLIGMRGLMADPQGQIISFPIRSNFREGLTLTEYFISCSGARKGLVDTALRTADTGYLTRRLVDVSHQVVIKQVACNTSRGIVLKALQSGPVGGPNKIILSLKERLIGRVLAEDIKVENVVLEQKNSVTASNSSSDRIDAAILNKTSTFVQTSSDLLDDPTNLGSDMLNSPVRSYTVAARDTEISPNLAFKIARLKDKVVVRSSLTCACTREVCQLCYGWSLSQGKLVSLGEAVGVIAAQSIGEPGTQLTMRTFHTGGVFSGDILQDIRAPHAGKVFFPQALQGLLVRTAQGQIAFLIKIPGVLLLDDGKSQVSRMQLEAATLIFVRQGEYIESNAVIGELALISKEGNQPIKSRQTLFAEFGGRVTHQRGKTLKVHKPETPEESLVELMQWSDVTEQDLAKNEEEGIDKLQNGLRLIEPTHSISLGIFRILAIRVGAIENHLLKFWPGHLQTEGATRALRTTNQRLVRASLEFELELPQGVGPVRSRLSPNLALLDKGKVGRFRNALTVNRYRTPSYFLNTIAEEGDLVDENYKDCINSVRLKPYSLK